MSKINIKKVPNFKDWHRQFSDHVKQHGLEESLAAHLASIEKGEHPATFLQELKGKNLLKLLKKDASVKKHIKSLPFKDRLLLGVFSFLAKFKKKKLLDSHSHEDFKKGLIEILKKNIRADAEIKEADGSGMNCIDRETFQNWGRTVENIPLKTCLPTTIIGVCNIVKWAKQNGKSVRVSGYRHTWGNLYSANDQVLISTLPLDVVNDLPAKEPGIDPNNELQGIKVVGEIEEGGQTKALCKIGAATTNEQFRRWCLNKNGGNYQWTIPLNVIMVEITWGGSNATICHGAGLRHQTLSDLVHEIEFVNAKGEVQVVNDPVQLKAASGCFGLLGVVTSVTLKLDPMTYVVMKPSKKRVGLTIPPPAGFSPPKEIDMDGISQADMDAAWKTFVNSCENDYYAEWFWFPYQQECWINTWNNDGLKANAEDYPGHWGSFFQEMESYLGQLANETIFKLLPGKWQAKLMAKLAMSSLPSIPPKDPIVTPLIDALHFKRGIQNMRVWDMEMEIPIPKTTDGKPDWSIAQKAWWMVIDLLYKRKDAPMRIALEMRVMGGSEVTMAAQKGNTWGTCSIEVLTNLNTKRKVWLDFMQQVTSAWDTLTDDKGNKLNIRPHWAKQWQGLKMRNKPIVDYLKDTAYADQIPIFKQQMESVAKAGGFTLQESKQLFSNELLNEIFEVVFSAPDV